MSDLEVGQGQQLRAEGWLQLENPNMTMDEARAELEQAGNVIIEVDELNKRFKVMDTVLIVTAGNPLDQLDDVIAQPETLELEA